MAWERRGAGVELAWRAVQRGWREGGVQGREGAGASGRRGGGMGEACRGVGVA